MTYDHLAFDLLLVANQQQQIMFNKSRCENYCTHCFSLLTVASKCEPICGSIKPLSSITEKREDVKSIFILLSIPHF